MFDTAIVLYAGLQIANKLTGLGGDIVHYVMHLKVM